MFSTVRGFHDPLPFPRSGFPPRRRGVGAGLPLRTRSWIRPAMMRVSPSEGGAWPFIGENGDIKTHARTQNRIDAVRLMCQDIIINRPSSLRSQRRSECFPVRPHGIAEAGKERLQGVLAGPSSSYTDGGKPEFVASLVLQAVDEGQAQYFANDRLRKMAGGRGLRLSVRHLWSWHVCGAGMFVELACLWSWHERCAHRFFLLRARGKLP
jgi:hypothetical protein